MTKFTLKPATKADHALIEKMHKKLFSGGKKAIPTLKDGWWWVLYAGNEPAGFAGMHPSFHYSNVGYLCRAGVLEKFQGHGLQKKLIAVREEKAKELGYAFILTDTAPNNYPSSNSLINCGFKLYGPRRGMRWAARHSLYWRKEL